MTKHRWLSGAVLLLVLALLAGACGGSDDDDATDTTAEGSETTAAAVGGVEINVLVEGGGLQLQEAIAEKWQAETGNTVNFIEVPYASVFDQLSAEMATGGSAYDVATIDVIWIPTFAEFAEPMDALFTDDVKADLPAALVSDAQFDGNFVGMPTWANAEILLYRKDLFDDPAEQAAFEDEYGHALAPPSTWDEFADVAAFFTRDTDGDGTVDFWGTDVKGAVETEWLAHILQTGSPTVVLDATNNVIINDANHLAALEFYTALECDAQVAPAGAPQVGWVEAQNLFYQGQTAMTRFWAHAYRLTPEDSTVEGLVGVAPMIGGAGGVAAIPGPWYNIVPQSSENKDVAMDFVKFAYDNNVLGIEAPLGLAARNSAYAEYASQDGFEHFTPLLDTLGAPGTNGRPAVAEWQQITDQVLVPLVQEAVGCNADLQSLLDDAKADIEDILN